MRLILGYDISRHNERYSLRVSYDGRFDAHTTENGGVLKLRAAF